MKSYRQESLASVSGKIMEQIFMEAILRHVWDKEVTRDGQHSFTKGKSHLSSLAACYSRVTATVNKGRPSCVVYQISVGLLAQSHMAAFPPNWRHRSLVDGLLNGEGIWSMALCPGAGW